MKNLFFEKSADPNIIKSSVRTKTNTIQIILEACRAINSFPHYEKRFTENTLFYIHISKQSRIFIFTNNSIHSLHFPFNIILKDGQAKIFFDKQFIEMDHIIFLLTIFETESVQPKSFDAFYNQILETVCNNTDFENINLDFIYDIIMFLFTFEDGYIRYDYDNSKRKNDKTHPINHLDIFYGNSSTFKLGLKKAINYKDFVDILNKNTPCKFLK